MFSLADMPAVEQPSGDIPADTVTALNRGDAVLLAEIIDATIQGKQAAVAREQAALNQAQKALGRAKRSSTQQQKQAEIEEMRERIANWQREIEAMKRVKEKF